MTEFSGKGLKRRFFVMSNEQNRAHFVYAMAGRDRKKLKHFFQKICLKP